MVENRWVYAARRFTSIESLFILVTFTAIVPGAYTQGRPKCALDSLEVAKTNPPHAERVKARTYR